MCNNICFIQFCSYSFRIDSVDVHYDKVPSVSWLFRRRLLRSSAALETGDFVPDYYVRPLSADSCSYGLFLPRNAFSQNSSSGIFQVEYLKFLTQGAWFTVFRYDDGTGAPFIIKRANIWTVSFKYLLREKAMLGYLNHPNIARPVSVSKYGLNGGFHPVACLGSGERYWNDTYFMLEDGGASLADISGELSVRDIKSIALQLLEVLIYLERMQVVHRDIRMESFVWSRGVLKLISLGKSKHMDPHTQAEKDATAQFTSEWKKPSDVSTPSGFDPRASSVRCCLVFLLLNI